ASHYGNDSFITWPILLIRRWAMSHTLFWLIRTAWRGFATNDSVVKPMRGSTTNESVVKPMR
ncbi:hypothetical protein CCACVL1_00041, partial [Corchorus capsularis]